MSNNVQQDCFTLQGLFGKLIYLFPDMRPNFQFENLGKGEDQNVGIKRPRFDTVGMGCATRCLTRGATPTTRSSGC